MLPQFLYTLLLLSPQTAPYTHASFSEAPVLASPNSLKRIASEITSAARKYNIERSLLSCILKKESEYRNRIISKTSDYGIAQINIKTARKYKFDVYHLTTDTAYSIDKAALILSDYERLNRDDEARTWFCRYNIGYQSLSKPNIGATCERYLAKVNKCLLSEVYL